MWPHHTNDTWPLIDKLYYLVSQLLIFSKSPPTHTIGKKQEKARLGNIVYWWLLPMSDYGRLQLSLVWRPHWSSALYSNDRWQGRWDFNIYEGLSLEGAWLFKDHHLSYVQTEINQSPGKNSLASMRSFPHSPPKFYRQFFFTALRKCPNFKVFF